MTNQLPSPLTPAECDLSDFRFMCLDVDRLFRSEFNATATDTEWRVGVTLWCRAWHQVPAGSLPDDDVALTRLADLGQDAKTWARVKAKALHGWTKCSDGRLYHQVVAEKALEAWIEKLGQRKSSGAGNAKRWGVEFDPKALNEAIVVASRMLAVINPQSRTLRKRTARGASIPPDGTPDSIPIGSPKAVPSGSLVTGTVSSSVLRTDAPASGTKDSQNRTEPEPFSKPASNDKAWVWGDGATWLSKATGKPRPQAKSLIGRWLRDVKENATVLRELIGACQDQGTEDPIPWITAAIKTRAQAAAPFEDTDEHGWRRRFESYAMNNAWPAKWGGSFPGDDKRHPKNLVEEFRSKVEAA